MIESARPIEERLNAAGLPTLPRLSWLEVDLAVLAANARALRDHLASRAELAVVTKADGYGHGLVAASHAALVGGASMLAVATLDEALVLRAAGFAARILVLYAVPRAALGDAMAADLDLVAMDRRSVEDLTGALRARPASLRDVPSVHIGRALAVADQMGGRPGDGRHTPRVHLGLDTGMTRGGFAPEAAAIAARALLDAGLPGLAGTWSHLASPEDPDAAARQVAAFRTGLDALASAGIAPGLRHLNATGGILGDASPDWDVARAGLAFFGHLPQDVRTGAGREGLHHALRPAIRLIARAASIEAVAAGAVVGYGGTWTAGRPSSIATIALGYADGWTRLYAPGSKAMVRGTLAPLVGRVGSDAVAIDVTDVPGFGYEDEVVLVASGASGGSTIEDLAGRRGSIPWEVLDNFTGRLSRVYLEGGQPVAVRYLDGLLITKPGFRLRTSAST